MNKDESKQVTTIIDHLPVYLGKAAISVCLNDFPLALASLVFSGSMGGAYIKIRNDQKVSNLLEELKEKIDKMERDQRLDKVNLSENPSYQEVAHKRLLLISAMDDNEDISLSASLIALCAQLSGNDSRDRQILKIVGEITTQQLRVFKAIVDAHHSVLTSDELRSRLSVGELEDRMRRNFIKTSQMIFGVRDFGYVLSQLNGMGLIVQVAIFGGSVVDPEKFVLPKITELGSYLRSCMGTVDDSWKTDF